MSPIVNRTILALALATAGPLETRAAETKAPPATLDKARLASLAARSIGPATMSGRVAAIAVDPAHPETWYLGFGTGGAFKTTDHGASFSAIFERQAVASIGAIAVAPSDPKVVWLGTGEGNDRNSSSWGNGVYRSTDGGETWQHVGLESSRVIPRIVVHPTDPATAWVAVLGDLWNPSGGRGLWKTTDGGGSWKRVLAADKGLDDRVGCGEVAIDPSNPAVLYAALYARRRTPWSFASGPAASGGEDVGGIYKSVDGGATWKRLGGGLPRSTGRIGIDIHRKNPRIVVAVVQSDEGGTVGWDVRVRSGGVYRSEDAGATWSRTSPLNPRPFYFSQIRIDPEDPRRVYLLGYLVHVSDDGGKTFREDAFKNVHADCHDLVIDPSNPKHLLLGTDGGPYQSFDAGGRWQHLATVAAGEFYRINVDDSQPYRICGGLQDNLNWVGPSRTFTKDGIVNADWINVGGGDGFYCIFDAENPNLVYAESQEGEIHRFDLATGQHKNVKPAPAEGQKAFRFHWNAPFIGSRHEKGVLYLGGNRVFRITDRGETFRPISPDLSAQDPDKTVTVGSGAETYGVVYTLAESPKKAGMLWAGTDDGKLWVTRDGGGSWTDLTASLPAAAKGQWLSRIEPSWADAEAAYLVVDAHRTGTFAPLAWRTSDGGKTWRSVASDLPADGPVKVLREDPSNPDLLFAGTEFGLFVSVDRGGRWIPFGNLPTVAVDDILVQQRERDLVIATHGRSLYVVDDLTPLEAWSAARDEAAYLFEPLPATGRHLLAGWVESQGSTGIFRGANPPEGAVINVWLREFTGDPVKIAVTNAQKQTVANLTLPGTPGINRVTWDLKPTKDVLTEYGGEGTLHVPSGDYEITLTAGKVKQTRTLRVNVLPGVETR